MKKRFIAGICVLLLVFATVGTAFAQSGADSEKLDESNVRYHYEVENNTSSTLTVTVENGDIKIPPRTTTIVHTNKELSVRDFRGNYIGYSYVGTYFNFYD